MPQCLAMTGQNNWIKLMHSICLFTGKQRILVMELLLACIRTKCGRSMAYGQTQQLGGSSQVAAYGGEGGGGGNERSTLGRMQCP